MRRRRIFNEQVNKYAPVAQQELEQAPSKRQVGGSSPFWSALHIDMLYKGMISLTNLKIGDLVQHLGFTWMVLSHPITKTRKDGTTFTSVNLVKPPFKADNKKYPRHKLCGVNITKLGK